MKKASPDVAAQQSAYMLKIRRYERADSAVVWELHNAALSATGAHIGNGPWDDDLRHIEQVYLQNSGEFLVGEYEGWVVAMGALKKTSADRAEIKRMRAAPSFQGNGFGQAILEALEQKATALGYQTLHLDTTVKQVAAQKLYRKNSYKETRRSIVAGIETIFYEKSIV